MHCYKQNKPITMLKQLSVFLVVPLLSSGTVSSFWLLILEWQFVSLIHLDYWTEDSWQWSHQRVVDSGWNPSWGCCVQHLRKEAVLCLWAMPGKNRAIRHGKGKRMIGSISTQEYSVNFQRSRDAESCHIFCGRNSDCKWWTWEPSLGLCTAFHNCTESGHPDVALCEKCISGEKEYEKINVLV